MADSDELLNTPIEVAHGFEIDLNTVVIVNHQLTIDGIASLEQRETDRIREDFAAEGREVLDSLVGFQEWFCHDLRRVANNLALVGLVTRLRHWVEMFTQELSMRPIGYQDSALIRYLKALNRALGEGPVHIGFFQELVTARDSVIHADSKAQWTYKKEKRQVARRYCSGSDLEISGEQLKEAVARAIEQVKWYDERLAPRRTRSSPLPVRSRA